MGFCSESLLLFAAFHPEKWENDCLGTFQWFGWRPWDLPRRHFTDFFGEINHWSGAWGDEKKPEIHTWRFSKVLLLIAIHKPKSGLSLWANIKNCWFQSCFGLIFIPGRWCEKPTSFVAWWMVSAMFAEMRWVPFFDRKYRRPCDSYRMGQMEGLMEGWRLVHWANVKLFQIWYIVTYGTEILYH